MKNALIGKMAPIFVLFTLPAFGGDKALPSENGAIQQCYLAMSKLPDGVSNFLDGPKNIGDDVNPILTATQISPRMLEKYSSMLKILSGGPDLTNEAALPPGAKDVYIMSSDHVVKSSALDDASADAAIQCMNPVIAFRQHKGAFGSGTVVEKFVQLHPLKEVKDMGESPQELGSIRDLLKKNPKLRKDLRLYLEKSYQAPNHRESLEKILNSLDESNGERADSITKILLKNPGTKKSLVESLREVIENDKVRKIQSSDSEFAEIEPFMGKFNQGNFNPWKDFKDIGKCPRVTKLIDEDRDRTDDESSYNVFKRQLVRMLSKLKSAYDMVTDNPYRDEEIAAHGGQAAVARKNKELAKAMLGAMDQCYSLKYREVVSRDKEITQSLITSPQREGLKDFRRKLLILAGQATGQNATVPEAAIPDAPNARGQ